MNRLQWERLCRLSRAMPEKKKEVPGGIVLIADGNAADNDNARYRTVWCFGRDDETLEVGRPLLFNTFYEDNGVMRPVTKEIRIAAAELDALQYAERRRG